jgi:WD40 repeat protein
VTKQASGRPPFEEYAKDSGVCVRTLLCHSDRVKRIALEGTADTFLTCSEDGTVRQHDLRSDFSALLLQQGHSILTFQLSNLHRVAHQCSGNHYDTCPPPLLSYEDQGVSLYTLSVSRARPEYIVVAGTLSTRNNLVHRLNCHLP